MEVVIFIGAQASGKSSFYKERFFRTHTRINLDMLKTRRRERLMVEGCIAAKHRFVVDNTNPTPEDRARYIPLARAARYAVVAYYFASSVEDCIERNARRSGRELIPNHAIWTTFHRLTPPRQDEGFDERYVVRLRDGGFEVERLDDET